MKHIKSSAWVPNSKSVGARSTLEASCVRTLSVAAVKRWLGSVTISGSLIASS